MENEANWGVGAIGLQADRFWSQGFCGSGVRIGIADSGIDGTHPTFAKLNAENRMAAFAHFNKLGQKQIQKRPNGEIVPDEEAIPTFSHWHGTHCAAILVGEPTAGKARGMAPDATLVVARVLEFSNEGSVASIMAGLAWLGSQTCDIVSLSLGWPGLHEDWVGQITDLLRMGTVVVAAVGNEFTAAGVGKSRSPANYPLAPSSSEEGILISIGAHNKDLNVWEESGGELIDWSSVRVKQSDGTTRPSTFATTPPQIVPHLIAPGVDIVSAIPGDKYFSAPGTSMATPHVAGLIALVLSALRTRQPSTKPRAAAELVLDCLVDVSPPGIDARSGRGRINIDALITKLAHVLT